MKGITIVLAVLLLPLLGLALWKGTDTFTLGLRTSTHQLIQFLPMIVVAMLMAGFAEVLLPPNLVETWLSDSSGWRGIVVAWLAGILTPGGSLMGMPLAAALFRVGVGIGVLVTYLTSLALMSVLRLPMEVGFYGWRLTALRVIVSVFLPPLAGLLAQAIAPFFLER